MKRFGLACVLAAALLLGGSALGGCGTASDTPPAAAAAFNDTDVMFLQMMVAYHEPGAKLTVLGEQKATSKEVRQLAAAMKATEADELTQILTWLRTWQQPETPATDAVLHADHGGLPADGKAQAETLAKEPAAKFDKSLLRMLIGHLHTIVEVARMEVSGGVHPEVKAFATRIADSRRAQVAYMLQLAE